MNRVANFREPQFKLPSFVSKKWRASANGKPCTLRLPGCDGGQTTVLCHLRMFGVSGVNEKPHDFLAVYGCHNCHGVIDGRADGPWGYDDILRALMLTLIEHHREGRIGEPAA